MDIENNELVVDLICSYEGFSARVYKDSAGIETIGYGTTNKQIIAEYCSRSITREQAQEYLIDHLRSTVYPIIDKTIKVNLNKYQWASLVSWIYNLGSGRFVKSGIAACINRNDFIGASSIMVQYHKAFNPKTGQREPLLGLMRRRLTESLLMQGENLSTQSYDYAGNFKLWLNEIKSLSYDECLAYVMDIEYNEVSN